VVTPEWLLTLALTRIAFTAAVVLVLALPAGARAGPGLNGTERAVIRELNDVRARHGLRHLRPSRALGRAADQHSRDMLRRDFFDHSSSDGTPFDRRVRRHADARHVGETLAAIGRRHGGAGAVVRMWMRSPPHRAILLSGEFRRVGIARRWGSLGASEMAVVTADFASRR
jgi:uncharacterized protein YkwD